jgi:hypothetical protein
LTLLTEIASNNGIRRLRFRLWESYLHKFVAISLQNLCISCKFLDSSLEVLCKFLEKFLAKSLQEFGAGGGKRRKVEPTMAPKSIQNGANLAQGVGKGYPKINRNMNKLKKRKRKHKSDKKK